LSVLQWLRSHRHYRETPVFVLSSRTASDQVDQAYVLGANSCLLTGTQPDGLDRIALGIATYASFVKSANPPEVA
jgi:hypothetical protein